MLCAHVRKSSPLASVAPPLPDRLKHSRIGRALPALHSVVGAEAEEGAKGDVNDALGEEVRRADAPADVLGASHGTRGISPSCSSELRRIVPYLQRQ
jgi:hypothetical protein